MQVLTMVHVDALPPHLLPHIPGAYSTLVQLQMQHSAGTDSSETKKPDGGAEEERDDDDVIVQVMRFLWLCMFVHACLYLKDHILKLNPPHPCAAAQAHRLGQ